MDDGGHNKEREDLRVQGDEEDEEEEEEGRMGRKGCGEAGVIIYVNNFHFPSAAVCITRHGPVVMVIATGQMMRK